MEINQWPPTYDRNHKHPYKRCKPSWYEGDLEARYKRRWSSLMREVRKNHERRMNLYFSKEGYHEWLTIPILRLADKLTVKLNLLAYEDRQLTKTGAGLI